MEWSIQQVARIAGVTSRTLRHYDDIGVLPPARVAMNGYRHYDEASLVRLQRVLLLRDLGLGLPQIRQVLDREEREETALEAHLSWLREEQHRLARQIASVESTITALKGGERLMAEKMFDGFDHTRYRQEVQERWGEQAYAAGDAWWRGMDEAARAAWKQRTARLADEWISASEQGIDPAGDEAQALAERHVAWLKEIPGTPAASTGGDLKGYVIGLGEMYVADPRFGANYGGPIGAEFVRDALRAYADAHL